MKRQLSDLRSAQSNSRRGGVMRVPAIMSVDAWEALASVQQDQLITDSYEDRVDRSNPVAIPEPDTSQRDHQEAYRKYNEQKKLGGLDYVRHREELIKQQTRKERIVR
jgi:predicted nuclease of restriction endonuclease-like RecB superfamily